MRCPFCEYLDSRVLDSRPSEDGNTIRRRRACNRCNKRFTTYERVESVPLMVIKKDMRREVFQPEKIRMSILRACEKRTLSRREIDEMVERVVKNIYASSDGEIKSVDIGNLVMEELKQADQVAYVRFASVYRQFTDISDIYTELNQLLSDSQKSKE